MPGLSPPFFASFSDIGNWEFGGWVGAVEAALGVRKLAMGLGSRRSEMGGRLFYRYHLAWKVFLGAAGAGEGY